MVELPPTRVNRKGLTILLFALSLAPNWGFCEGDRISIEVGTLSAEDGDGWMLSQIRGFEAAHPEIDIRHFAIGPPSRDQTRIQDLPELALNVIGVRSDMGYEIGYLVDNDLIEPIESFLPDPDFRFDDFFPNVWDYVSYKGHRWGVPYLCSSVLLIADWNVFKNSGIAEPPMTWEELLKILPKMTRDTDGDGAIDQYGFRLGMRGRHDTHMYYLWMTKVLQDGGDVMKNGRFDLSHPALRTAYDFMRQLQESPGSHRDNRRFKTTAGDLTYRYGLQIAPSYYLNPLMKQLNYRIVPWVTSGRNVILDERRHYLCVAKSTPEKEKASWEFLKWVTRKNAEHPDGAWTFHLSARKDLLERKDVQHRIKSWAKGFDVMHETKGWNVHHGDQVLGRFEAMSHLEEIVTAMFHDELGFDEAMRKAEVECNAILDEFAKKKRPDSPPSPRAATLENLAEMDWRSGDFQKAAIDGLELVGLSPDMIHDSGFRFRLISSLRNSGCFWAAETIATTKRPSFVAPIILRELKLEAGHPAAIDDDRSDDVEKAIRLAEIACASAYPSDSTSETLDQFILDCRELLDNAELRSQDWARLAVVHRGALDLAIRRRTYGETTRTLIGRYDLTSIPSKEYAKRVAEDSIEIASRAASLDARWTPLVFDALDFRIEVGRKMEDLEGIVHSYRSVLNRFPENSEAEEYFFALADLLKDEVHDLDAALEVCEELEERADDRQVARKARFQCAKWLFEAARYAEAKDKLAPMVDPEDEEGDLVRVLGGLCDYALGNCVEGENLVQEFIRA
ncbi:MAG: extracellular solute-binding protein, partial [Candidatus Omnitrophica bacterium]|nr:extracellular solute-binding protein [Candidatus Omnitrophota bacterium]